jgi:hypothetical protein
LSPTLRATLPTKEKVAPKKEGKKARHIYIYILAVEDITHTKKVSL